MAGIELMRVWKSGDSLVVTLKADMVRRLDVEVGDLMIGYVAPGGILVASKDGRLSHMHEALQKDKEVKGGDAAG